MQCDGTRKDTVIHSAAAPTESFILGNLTLTPGIKYRWTQTLFSKFCVVALIFSIINFIIYLCGKNLGMSCEGVFVTDSTSLAQILADETLI